MRTAVVRTIAALVALGVLATGGGSSASEHQWRAACTSDAFAHCTAAALRGDRAGVKACMVAKLDRLSDGCRIVIISALADNGPPPLVASPMADPSSAAPPDRTHKKDP